MPCQSVDEAPGYLLCCPDVRSESKLKNIMFWTPGNIRHGHKLATSTLLDEFDNIDSIQVLYVQRRRAWTILSFKLPVVLYKNFDSDINLDAFLFLSLDRISRSSASSVSSVSRSWACS